MKPGVYCTKDAADRGDPDDQSRWIVVSQVENEIGTCKDVDNHCSFYGENHRKYLAIVTPNGKVHHHIYKGPAIVDT